MFASEGVLIAAPHVVVVGEEVDDGNETVLWLSEDLAIEHHDTAFVRTVRGHSQTQFAPGRSGHHSRPGVAPRIARSEPRPMPADGVAGVRWLSRSWPPSPTQ